MELPLGVALGILGSLLVVIGFAGKRVSISKISIGIADFDLEEKPIVLDRPYERASIGLLGALLLAIGIVLIRPSMLSQPVLPPPTSTVTAAPTEPSTPSPTTAIPEPQMFYFIVDATDRIKPFFDEVRTEVKTVGRFVLGEPKIGLRIYGGNISGTPGCRDTKQVLEPNPHTNAGIKIDSILSSIQPSGQGSLTVAVLDAIYDDLSKHEGPIKLIVITSGADPRCDPREGGILESRAKDIRHDLEVVLISIGDLIEEEASVLDSYAEALGGVHVRKVIKTNRVLFAGKTDQEKGTVGLVVKHDFSTVEELYIPATVVCAGMKSSYSGSIPLRGGLPIIDRRFSVRLLVGHLDPNTPVYDEFTGEFTREFDSGFWGVRGTWHKWAVLDKPLCENSGTWSASRLPF